MIKTSKELIVEISTTNSNFNKMNNSFQSLYEVDSTKKENETIDRLCLDMFPIANEGIIKAFSDLHWRNHIICVRIPYHYIDKSIKKKKNGDVDLAFIPFTTSGIAITDTHNIFNDFELDYSNICSVEVKVMQWEEDPHLSVKKMTQTKNSPRKLRKARQQAERNYNKGFAQSLLLYIVIAKTPEYVDGSHGIDDWFYSSELASNGLQEAINPKLENSNEYGVCIYSTEDDIFGTALLGYGGIYNQHETYSGSITGPKILKLPKINENSLGNNFIKKFQNILSKEFGNYNGKFKNNGLFSTNFPLVVRACSEDSCKKIYIAPTCFDNCPICHSPPK